MGSQHFATLIRSSRFFTLPRSLKSQLSPAVAQCEYFPTEQIITTPERARHIGDWGLKRNLPPKMNADSINLREIDTIEHQTDFSLDNRFQRVFETIQDLDLTISNQKTNVSGNIEQMKWSEAFEKSEPVPLDVSKDKLEEGPWILDFSARRFKKYVKTLKESYATAAAFREFKANKASQTEEVQHSEMDNYDTIDATNFLKLPRKYRPNLTHPTAGLRYSTNNFLSNSAPSNGTTRQERLNIPIKARVLFVRRQTRDLIVGIGGIVAMATMTAQTNHVNYKRFDMIDLYLHKAVIDTQGRLALIMSTNPKGLSQEFKAYVSGTKSLQAWSNIFRTERQRFIKATYGAKPIKSEEIIDALSEIMNSSAESRDYVAKKFKKSDIKT